MPVLHREPVSGGRGRPLGLRGPVAPSDREADAKPLTAAASSREEPCDGFALPPALMLRTVFHLVCPLRPPLHASVRPPLISRGWGGSEGQCRSCKKKKKRKRSQQPHVLQKEGYLEKEKQQKEANVHSLPVAALTNHKCVTARFTGVTCSPGRNSRCRQGRSLSPGSRGEPRSSGLFPPLREACAPCPEASRSTLRTSKAAWS